MRRGFRPAGYLIPWTVAEQFQDQNFVRLNGVRVVRIATHPNAAGKGYGSKALELLKKYYQGELMDLDKELVDEAEMLKATK